MPKSNLFIERDYGYETGWDAPLNKTAAKKLLISEGYSEFSSDGESGDYGFGSRLYYCKPGAKKNRFGMPYKTATMSRIPGGWDVIIPLEE